MAAAATATWFILLMSTICSIGLNNVFAVMYKVYYVFLQILNLLWLPVLETLPRTWMFGIIPSQ